MKMQYTVRWMLAHHPRGTLTGVTSTPTKDGVRVMQVPANLLLPACRRWGQPRGAGVSVLWGNSGCAHTGARSGIQL